MSIDRSSPHLSMNDIQNFMTHVNEATLTKKAQLGELMQELENKQALFTQKIEAAKVAALSSHEEAELTGIAKDIDAKLSEASLLNKDIQTLEKESKKISQSLNSINAQIRKMTAFMGDPASPAA